MAYMRPIRLFKQLKRSHRPQCRLLGIDTGDSYTGFASTNCDLTKAWAIKTCCYKNPRRLLNEIVKLIEEEDIGGCLVGYSPVMHDHDQEMPHRARVFRFLEYVFGSEELESFPFTFADERFSSKDADNILDRKNFRNPLAYERARNKYAACCFTQKWLNLMNCQIHLEGLGDYWNSVHQ